MARITKSPAAQDGSGYPPVSSTAAEYRASPSPTAGPTFDDTDVNLSGIEKPHPDSMVPQASRGRRFYAINVGMKVGITDNWTLADRLTKGVSGSPEGFATWELAHACYSEAFDNGLVEIREPRSRAQSPRAQSPPAQSPRAQSPRAQSPLAHIPLMPCTPPQWSIHAGLQAASYAFPTAGDFATMSDVPTGPGVTAGAHVFQFVRDPSVPVSQTLASPGVEVVGYVTAQAQPAAHAPAPVPPPIPAPAPAPAPTPAPATPEIQFLRWVRNGTTVDSQTTPTAPSKRYKGHASQPLNIISPSFAKIDTGRSFNSGKGKGRALAQPSTADPIYKDNVATPPSTTGPIYRDNIAISTSDYELAPEYMVVKKKKKTAHVAPTPLPAQPAAPAANVAPVAPAANVAPVAPVAPAAPTAPRMTLELANAILRGTQPVTREITLALVASYINGHSEELSRANGRMNRRPGSPAYLLSGNRGSAPSIALNSGSVSHASNATAGPSNSARSSHSSRSSNSARTSDSIGTSNPGPSAAATRMRPHDAPPRTIVLHSDDEYDVNGIDFNPETVNEINSWDESSNN